MDLWILICASPLSPFNVFKVDLARQSTVVFNAIDVGVMCGTSAPNCVGNDDSSVGMEGK